MDARPGIENLCGLNRECKFSGQPGGGNLRLRKVYGLDRIRYLRCSECGVEFSERKGTALFNCKISEGQAVSVIDHLDRSCGVVATAELVGVCKDAVSRLLRVSGRASRQLHEGMVHGLAPEALQFDEKWSFVAKKQRQVTEADPPGEVGDQWDTVGLDPQSKLLVSLVPGPRTGAAIHQAVADAAHRLAPDAPIPALFTDGEPTYETAIRQVFGRRYRVPRTRRRGRPPQPVLRIPQALVYAQVVKRRQGDRIKAVEIRPIFGKGKLPQVLDALGWNTANTSAIERFNLTDRMRNGRKMRKTLGFSKKRRCHEAMRWLSALRYNFHHPHRSLRQQNQDGRWEKRTPAMAVGLTDRIWSTIDLLRRGPIVLG